MLSLLKRGLVLMLVVSVPASLFSMTVPGDGTSGQPVLVRPSDAKPTYAEVIVSKLGFDGMALAVNPESALLDDKTVRRAVLTTFNKAFVNNVIVRPDT